MDDQLDRRQTINNAKKRGILQNLQHMLHEHHALIRLFKTALDRMPIDDYKVVVRADKQFTGTHERQFNTPTIDEAANVSIDENMETSDIALTRRESRQFKIRFVLQSL